ncbi:MAG: insulinase family protein [Anaerolineaceae bacterium]|nr:insulinase family protein [Anaerolineaceae bacterium]
MGKQIVKKTLQNGLTIHLKEIHTAPIISHWAWYRVGSRNEAIGQKGISHWVEHMQFKGTPDMPASVLDKAISRTGGYWNAFTYLDWTAYFQTLPAKDIDLALKLEADRMVNCLYEPEEVESERTVIISELEGGENEPMVRLSRAMQRAAFDQHTYKYEVIGEKEDLLHLKRDDLFDYYQLYYAPNNALIALAGDFDAQEMLIRLENLYRDLKPSELLTEGILGEPIHQEERRVEQGGPGDTTYLRVSYHAPEASNPDFFALSVLDSLFSGPSGLNMFGGGGVSNKTSRLYKKLVEREYAVGLSGGAHATIDPYLYDITMVIHPDKNAETALCVLGEEVERLQNDLVSETEINRAIKQAKALFAYGTENITNQGFWLGYAEMFDKYDWFASYIDELEKVTSEDIQRIAQTYLRKNNRVVGTYKPENQGGKAS